MDGYTNELFALSNLPGLLACVLLAFSYYMTSIYWLRVLTVLGLFLLILYFRLAAGSFGLSVVWAGLFILINLYQLFWLVRNRVSLNLPEEDAPLLREALSGLDDGQIARLLKAAEWKTFSAGDVLTRQDAPLDSLFYLLSGRASVAVNSSLITHLEKGSFIGEIAYLTGNPATATVTIEEPSRALAFNRVRMAMKMRRTNTRRVLLDEPTGV
jgi:Cyclic nucleotide-binding domain